MGSVQKEWLVYFSDARTVRYAKWIWWWKPKPGFRHCGALHYDINVEKWLHVEFNHAGIETTILSPIAAENLFDKLYDFEILVCPKKDDWHLMRIKELSCVSFIMRLIGFYRWWIITPYQLYCALLKAGYSSFWQKRETNGKKNS
jgi:hypothetical protein